MSKRSQGKPASPFSTAITDLAPPPGRGVLGPLPVPAGGAIPAGAVLDGQLARGSLETKPPADGVAHEQIAQAAYFRWLQHGGSPEENWLAAERELRGGS